AGANDQFARKPMHKQRNPANMNTCLSRRTQRPQGLMKSSRTTNLWRKISALPWLKIIEWE
ncbi:MAG: hypothetical protein ACLQIQ_14335, partial [Beijerinckiaceae bacterium]